MKKLITSFCMLCLLVSCFAVMPMKAEATAVSQASAVAWTKSQIGKGLDYDGVYGNQCVDLIYYYYKYLGVSPVGGNASAYISNKLPAGWKRISSNIVPQPGDIAVFKTNYKEMTNSYGHVGIALSGTSSKFSLVHQNYSGRKYCSQTDNLSTDMLACVIRPNFGATGVSLSWSGYPEKHSVGKTNAVLAGRCDLNVDISAVSQVGIYLYDAAGNTLTSKTEKASISGYKYFYVWYDVNSSLGYTLTPSTTYRYKFMATVNGKTYYSPEYEFKTGGHTHKYSGAVTKQPTCTENGTKTYTCSCGSSYTEGIPATGHAFAAATCTSPKKCKTCGAISGNALGHSYKTVISKATTAKNGVVAKKCSVCGYVGSKAAISYAKTFTLSATSFTYTGKANNPVVTVKDAAGKTLVRNKDYTLTYSSGRINAGTYKVVVKLIGNYTGTKTLTFKVNPAKVTSKFAFKLSATSYTYDGKVKSPTVTVKNAAGKTLKKNTDYTVSYAKGRKNVGTYKVVVKLIGNYTGTKTLTFKIVPKAASINKLTAKSKAIVVKLNRSLQQSTGYEIQYSTAKNFKGAKTKVIKSYKTSSVTLSGLKAKTTYYVRIRTYKTVDGVKYYSNWCTYKYIKTK